MSGKLDRKVALITGAGRGIGRATALKLSSEGARVVINDLDAEQVNEVMSEVRSRGGEAVACVGSVTAQDFPERFIATAIERYDGLDIIVNNAGYTWDGVIQKTTDEQWYAILDCHLTAPFRILRAAQPVIRRLVAADAEAGRLLIRKVVTVSSISGLFGNVGQTNYSAAKSGIVGMTSDPRQGMGKTEHDRQLCRLRFHRDPSHPHERRRGSHGGYRRTANQARGQPATHAGHRKDHPAWPLRHARGGCGSHLFILHTGVGLRERSDSDVQRRSDWHVNRARAGE